MLMIEVYSPSIDRSYDFQISEDTMTQDAVRSFCEMIAKKNGESAEGIAEKSSLYDMARQREADMNRTLAENGITSGMKLILA